MIPEIQQEHRWLKQLVGDWRYELEAEMELGKGPEKFTGTESVRSLGDLWVLCEGRGDVPGGGTATSLMTLGYDPERQHFVGTFITSMMTYLWVYERGVLDASGKSLALDADGPSMTEEGGMAKYRDTIQVQSDDHRRLRAQVLDEENQWQELMTVEYYRLK